MLPSSLADALKDAPLPELLAATESNAAHKTLFLQTFRNKLAAPILNFPPEITSHMFYYYASLTKSLSTLKWTSLLFVCRTWRDIGLSTPLLWSYIELVASTSISPRLAKKLSIQRQRAGDWPLTFKWSSYTRHSDGLLDMHNSFLWEPEYLRALSVRASASTLCLLLERMASSNHTQLEHFALETIAYHREEPPLENAAQSHAVIRIQVQESILATMPQLKSLHLHGVSLDFSMINNLTTLKLEHTREHVIKSGYSFTLVELLSALQRCPQMQVLQVAIPDDSSLEIPPLDVVRLADLQYLHLTAFEEPCAIILTHLRFPTTASIFLIEGSYSSRSGLESLAFQLRQHYSSAGTISAKSIAISTDGADPPILWIVASLDVVNHQHFLLSDTSDSSIYFRLRANPKSQEVLRQIITNMPPALPVSGVTHVDGTVSNALTARSWRSLISLLPAIRTVAVCPASSARVLVMALNWFLHERGSRPLAEIHLDGNTIAFRVQRSEMEREHVMFIASDTMRGIIAYIANAKERGLPLDAVKLTTRCDYLPMGVQVKNIHQQLTDGLYFDGLLYNKESAEESSENRAEQNQIPGFKF